METNTHKNGTAFICKESVYYKTGDSKKIGKRSFTQGNVYTIVQNCYLKDDFGIVKNYSWFEKYFDRAPEHDLQPKPKRKKKSVK